MRTLVFALLSMICAGAPAHELEGVWTFEREVNTRADGSPAGVPAAEYDGVLIYTHDGHVSANVMPRGRAWTLDKATFADLVNSMGEGAATGYAGRYTVDAAAKTVTHEPAVSIDPADIGQKLLRRYELAGDKLLLSGKWRYKGEELTFTVHWVRSGAPAEAPASAADAADIVTLVKWEHAAVAADLAGDAEFYARNLADDWTCGMSNGEFQTKQMLLADLRDPKRSITHEAQIRDVRVRLNGEVAIVTFTETYDALIHGKRIAKTIISTDTFQKRAGRWMQITSHSSAMPPARK